MLDGKAPAPVGTAVRGRHDCAGRRTGDKLLSMLDAATMTRPPAMQRARGAASVRLGPGGLERLRQQGSAKAILPRGTAHPEVVFLNTAGGVTGGDRFDFSLDVASGTATGTTQTAERAYRSAGGAAEVEVRLSAGPGARLAWLPQETILFDGCALYRRTTGDLARDATFLGCEMLVLGRRAMGETVQRLDVLDRREVRRNGRPLLIEPLRLDAASLGPSPALIGGAAAIASVWVVAPDAGDRLSTLRTAHEDVESAASAWNGRAVLRMRAADPAPLRAALTRTLAALHPLPRVWPR